MNIEDIKVGETYNVRVKVDRVDTAFNAVFFTIEGGDTVYAFGVQDRKIHDLISPVIKVEGVCPSPKYDPCRLLKEGDKVQVIARNGRCWGKTGEYLRGAYCFVLEDEERNAMVKVRHNSSEYTIDPAYLELVTPVEELDRFCVEENCGEWRVLNKKSNLIASVYNGLGHPHAKKAAEAECARLNEEYRKEQSND